jgi:hypothetical protein
MNLDEDTPKPLHTQADDIPPLSADEALSMGRQTETRTRNELIRNQVVYGDIEGTPENEDQNDAHHAESDEHL